jgi:hypothetical protein
MSDFMRKQLSLDIISAWRENNGQNEMGKSVIHDWSALSGILFIGGDYGCLFGDVNYDGLANRLMNMYLGLPWIPTDSALKVLDKKLGKNKEILENNHQSEQKQRQDRRGFIEQQLETYRSELDEIPLNIDIRDHLNQENEVYLQAQQKTRELNNKLNMIMQDSHQIEMSLIQVKRDYQYFQEAKAVNLIFNGLEPTCCPHCQTSISDARRFQEIQTHSCSLCGEAMISDSETDDCRENELKEQLTKLSEALKEYEQLIASLKNEILDSEDKVTESKLRCEQLEAKINDFNQRYELERRISGLEFLLNEEYQEYPGFLEESEIQNSANKLEILNREIKVIKKAIAETKQRIESHQKNLLIEVSKKIQEYAIRFGMTSLEEVKLKSNPQLKLKKDGVSTTYSQCTDGEKLRLKIASVIALISIAENQGIGRHPGLLLIDSPKREEITDKDVAQIVAGLETLTKELPYLQVFLAATASEGILRYFDEDHRKYAEGDDFLW